MFILNCDGIINTGVLSGWTIRFIWGKGGGDWCRYFWLGLQTIGGCFYSFSQNIYVFISFYAGKGKRVVQSIFLFRFPPCPPKIKWFTP